MCLVKCDVIAYLHIAVDKTHVKINYIWMYRNDEGSLRTL